MRLTHLLCLILLDFWPGQANKAESDQSCHISHQLEEGIEVYMHSVVKPLMEYFKQINQKLDKSEAAIEIKNSQIRELEEKLIRFHIEAESKKNYTIQMEEKIMKLQMENSNYKTKEDSLSAVLKELTSQTLKIEQLQNKLCEKQTIQIKDLKEQCQIETQKTIKCDSELKNQKEIIVSKDTKNLQLELEVKDKLKELAKLTQEIRLLNVSKEQQNEEIVKLNVKINLEAQKLTKCNRELNNQKERTVAEISLKDKKLETEAKESFAKSKEIENLTQEIRLLNISKEQQNIEILKLNTKINLDAQKLMECNRELNNQKERTVATESVAKSQEIESMKQQINLLNSSNNQLSTEKIKLNDMIGWTIIQQRVRGSVDFYRNWTEYKNGFGDFWDGDFFLGLETIHRLTSAQPHELFIHMEYFNNDTFYAKYEEFAISGEEDQYRLSKLGKFSGNTSDELSYHIKSKFSTPDSDNDGSTLSCSTKHRGGWWYHFCTKTNLNGVYSQKEVSDPAENIFWGTWTAIKEVRMMIRPKFQQ